MRELDHVGLAWASGLLVGEGSIGTVTSKNSSGVYEYLHIQISMYDERAIKRFADIFKLSYREIFLKQRQHLIYKATATGRTAENMLRDMWPFLEGTDKADQALLHARKIGVEAWITEKELGDRPQLTDKPRGRTSAAVTADKLLDEWE